jgi:DNA-binding helix-hairpin-helix protein with protein kinase domain
MFTDEDGRQVILGERVGSPGVAGTAYAVFGKNDTVAKVYHDGRLPDRKRCEKLEIQVAAAYPQLREIAAWPQKLIFKSGRIVGFLMPRIPGRSIHLLYRPDDRKKFFPKATWHTLIDVARNVAAGFHCLHQYNVIMGDVNESNVFVTAETGQVRFIDCDSFQIQAPHGQIFPCSEFTSGWTPPELIEKPALVSRRTVQHDLFGLAVMVFHLLFMGRHPFAGVPPEHLLENSPSIEELIRLGVFPYSQSRRGSFKPPPNFLTLQDLPDGVAKLFERAFLSRDRPSAREWCYELERIELKKCQWGHVFCKQLRNCPWCSIWGNGGGNFFIVITSRENEDYSLTDIENLVAAVSAASFPDLFRNGTGLENKDGYNFIVPSFSSLSVPNCIATPFPKIPKERMWFVGGMLILLWGFIMIFIVPGAFFIFLSAIISGAALMLPGTANPAYNQEIERRKNAPIRFKSSIFGVLSSLQQLSVREAQVFSEEKRKSIQRITTIFWQKKLDAELKIRVLLVDLRITRDAMKDLPVMRDALRRNLAKQAQLEAYLRSVKVPNRGIPQIGSARHNILVSYGIFTAWDVKHMKGVPGLGSGVPELRGWLYAVEQRFQFNAAAPLPSSAEQEVQRTVKVKAQEILKDYQSIRSRWMSIKNLIDSNRLKLLSDNLVSEETQRLDTLIRKSKESQKELCDHLDTFIKQYAQAVVDFHECPRPV